MAAPHEPSDLPPAYADIIKAPARPGGPPTLQVPSSHRRDDDGSSIASSDSGGPPYHADVPGQARASMEDAARELPEGWVRRWDRNSGHHFYVDTRKNPPRSIWTHPYDQPEYHDSAPPHDPGAAYRRTSSLREQQRASSSSSSSATGATKLGRRIKDKLTHSTHEERVRRRQEEAEQERRAYERLQAIRAAFAEADRTGAPVLLGQDRNGRDVYAQPGHGMYGGGYGYPTPFDPYGRRGYGYGGQGRGYGGAGLGLPVLGGLVTGALLGGALM